MALKIERRATLGHAVGSENGTYYGAAGNQTGKELRYQEWYNRGQGWTHVFRAKDTRIRALLAANMSAAVENRHIGYDQNQRTTLYREANNVNWDISKITTDCETDCSALISVCCNASRIKVSKDMYTGNQAAALKATGAFKTYTADAYTKSQGKLLVGDILLGPGHTAMVVAVKDIYTFDRVMKYVNSGFMTGDDIKQLQTRLKELGYYTGKPDGIYGMLTEEAVVIYQREAGIKADGIAGKNTIKSLGYNWGG